MGAETSTITGVEMFRKILIEEKLEITLVFFEVFKRRHQRGMVICKPGSVKPHATLKLRFIS
jgi:elongation factor Tu